MPEPQLIRVRKYPNRRLYDVTRKRHLTHEELYDLVVAGHTVSVTDSRTERDITNLVLAQALIERSPEKLGVFPPEVFHLLVRAGEHLLRGFAGSWFSQVLREMAGGAGVGGTRGQGGVGGAWAPWWGGAPAAAGAAPSGPARSEPAPAGAAEVAELRARLEAMRREVEALKAERGA